MPDDADLDCLIVGGGPTGLTAALYLARFRRRTLVVDAGDPRAAWIPTSHNIPFFADGIGGAAIVARIRGHAEQYGARIAAGEVTGLARAEGGFVAAIAGDAAGTVRARRVLLATGCDDVEPELPALRQAVRRGLIRYCPICDGYEAQDKRIAVLGHGAHGLGEAIFIARTYAADVTLLTLGEPLALDEAQAARAAEHGVRVVHAPVAALEMDGERIAAFRIGEGEPLRFDTLYSALGLVRRAGLATALGAETDVSGALLVDAHNQTTVRGLYAAGGVVRGLDQVVVGLGHAAVAATHIHNRCEFPTEDEPEPAGQRQGP